MADLVDFGDYPTTYTHGIADVQVIANEVHFLLFRWRRLDGIWRPVIVQEVVRPAARMGIDRAMRLAAADLATPPAERTIVAIVH